MTFKLKKTELFKALMSVLCVLAVAFAVVLLFPRSAAAEDEPEIKATYTVTWECKIKTDDGFEWQSFGNGKTLYTYDGEDYSGWVRASIKNGDAPAVEVYNNGDDIHLSYSGTFEGETVTALVNATEYTITIEGAPDGIVDDDKTIKISIAPAVFELSADDFVEYYGVGDDNRLWLLGEYGNTSTLSDLVTYYDPDAEFNNEYGANIKVGMLYNAYTRYTGEEQTVILNNNYVIKSKPLSDYLSEVKGIAYTHNDGTDDKYKAQPVTGSANVVNKITTKADVTLYDNWVFDNGAKTVTLTKEWYIVTLVNALRSINGDEYTRVEGWSYSGEVPAFPVRPEHGDHAVLTLYNNQGELAHFAVKYSGTGNNTVLKYYAVKAEGDGYVIDTEKALEDDYYEQQFSALKVGAYTLNVSVPAYVANDKHEHWWNNAEEEATNVVYCPVSRTYSFAVTPYEVTADNVGVNESDNKDITIKFKSDHVEYNGLDNNFPDAVVTFCGVELTYDVDYEFVSDSKNAGKASVMFVGKGSFSGTVQFDNAYDITPAVNSWKDVPSVMYWTYGNYDKQMNIIHATPTYLDNPNDVSFKVTTDMEGEKPAAEALASFGLTDGLVSDDVAESLSALPVGTYYLFATVNESTNYKALVQRGVAFKVFPASNNWKVTPAVVAWTEGKFKSSINMPVATPLYGNATIVIKDSNGKDVYSNVTGVNKLSSAKAGTYTLTATVMGSNDYDGLVYSTVFNVHEKPGIPVWATVLIVLGSLLAVAVIIFVLIKTGVLRILTAKLMISIRTQAAVDATVAAVRASERNYAYKQQMSEKKQAAAKRQEQSEARKAKAEQEKALPLDQKIAALEEKARKAEARAEKMKARAESIQQRADRMRESANPESTEQPAAEPTVEAAATDNGTTTEE